MPDLIGPGPPCFDCGECYGQRTSSCPRRIAAVPSERWHCRRCKRTWLDLLNVRNEIHAKEKP